MKIGNNLLIIKINMQRKQSKKQQTLPEWIIDIIDLKNSRRNFKDYMLYTKFSCRVALSLQELAEIVVEEQQEQQRHQDFTIRSMFMNLFTTNKSRKHRLEKKLNEVSGYLSKPLTMEDREQLISRVYHVLDRDDQFFWTMTQVINEAYVIVPQRLKKCENVFNVRVSRNDVDIMSVCVFSVHPIQENRFITIDPLFWIWSAIGREPQLPHNFAVALHSFTAHFFNPRVIICNPYESMSKAFMRARISNIIPIRDKTHQQIVQMLKKQYDINPAIVRQNGCISFNFNPRVIQCTNDLKNFFKTVFIRYKDSLIN